MYCIYKNIELKLFNFAVVPHAGTWIEIVPITISSVLLAVVPHAGTWIEILADAIRPAFKRSFPTRERGLKLLSLDLISFAFSVVPHAGTWIEINSSDTLIIPSPRRSPRGNVD